MASESLEPKENFHFFSGKDSPFHPHHKAEFKVDDIKYNFIEQYILHKKAEFCKAPHLITDVMKVGDPNQFKKIEKTIVVADNYAWENKLKEYLIKGYMEKGRQCKPLFDLLQDTKGKLLVYASRKDGLLGIGVDATDPLSRRRSNWKGRNILGELLMRVREDIQHLPKSSLNVSASKRQESPGGSTKHKEGVRDKESDGSEKFTFFWQKESPFSQWHPCSFVIDDQWYNCAEQYMMHQKAVTCGDHSSAERVLKAKSPKEQKRLGREVSNFDDKKWSSVAMDVVKKGNLAKFGQNEALKRLLFETTGTTLVEASPADAVWGIGLAETDPRAKDREQWLGKNQLGQVLTKVREELMLQESGIVHSNTGERSLGARDKGDAGKPTKRKADETSQFQDKKRTDGVTNAKLSKGHDPTTSKGDRDQLKGRGKNEQTQRQNSSQKKDRITQEENRDTEMTPQVKNWDDKMANVGSNIKLNQETGDGLNGKTTDLVEKTSISRCPNEASVPLEKMEFSDVTVAAGNKEEREAVDPAWDGLNTMELDMEEDTKEIKRHERSKDKRQEKSDRERPQRKGYKSRWEQETPEDTTQFKVQGLAEKFTFFWRADSPFSQHHPADFQVESVRYNCAEQYMMHQKAVVFKDARTGYEIMNTSNPAKQKSLAKQVEGFDDVYWKTLRRNVVKTGNIAKFSQNPRLRRMLFATAGTTMVEASPMDNTWGIGLGADDPKAWDRHTWAGGNLLGQILTEVREELMEKFKNVHEVEEDRMSYRKNDGYDAQCTVFWRPVSPFHPRYPVGFVLDSQNYWTLQQYFFHQKALFFDDTLTARAIMETSRANKLEELGRKVRNYDNHLWSRYCRSFLRRGNYAKFSQNPNIGQQLIDNVLNGELAFAVEEDCLLGVGLREEDGRIYRKQSWKGKNLLGRALMEVREMLMKGDQSLPEIVEDPEDEVTAEEIPEQQFKFFFVKSPFNQWHLCRFTVGGIRYNCAEQYMWHQMALHFGDPKAAADIMRCRHPREVQTVDIRGYSHHEQEKVCKDIILKGNFAKFSQDFNLKKELVNTEDAVIAYSCEKDTLLGIGLRDTDPRAFDQQNWPGYNLLGEVLMEVREELKRENISRQSSRSKTSRSESKESVELTKDTELAEKFTFFWKKSPFSQWWMCDITIDGAQYNCSEQYMMHQKAVYFKDEETAERIMRNGRPIDQWQLGREVQGYVADDWNAVCRDVVKKGNFAKFSQHPRLRKWLFDTAGTTLVEASPKDAKWGIGLREDDSRARRRETWMGQNLLGQILTEVREELMKQKNDHTQNYSASNIPGSGSGHDRRGSEHSDSSQGPRKDSESGSREFPHHQSYQKSRSDRGGPTGRPNQSHGGGNQWAYQTSESERGGAAGRPNQHVDGENQRSHQNSRSFHAQRSHVDESRHYRDGDRQRPLMNASSEQNRNTGNQNQVEKTKPSPSGHPVEPVSQKSSSVPSGRRHGSQDLHSVPAGHSKGPVTQSLTTQRLPSRDSDVDSGVVVDGTASNENIHVISEKATLSPWYQKTFKADGLEYKSVGQYVAHQKALMFNDGASAEDIMQSTSSVRIMKSEKYIDGSDENKWNSVYRNVIKDGNYYKFSQNENLKQDLLATGGSLLAYGDVKDRKLGVGLKSDDRNIRDRKRWKGENMLGFVLMEVREDIINGRDSSKTSKDQVSDVVEHHDDLKEIIKEDERGQILDRDEKEVISTTAADVLSQDTAKGRSTDEGKEIQDSLLHSEVEEVSDIRATMKEPTETAGSKLGTGTTETGPSENEQLTASSTNITTSQTASEDNHHQTCSSNTDTAAGVGQHPAALGDHHTISANGVMSTGAATSATASEIDTETSADRKSLDTGHLEATTSLCLEDKGEPEVDAEAVAREPSAEYKKDNVSKVQRRESLQDAALPEETTPMPLVSTDNQPDPTDASQVVEPSSTLAVQQKGDAAETKSGQAAEQTTAKPLVSTDNLPDPTGASKVVEPSSTLAVQQKVDAAETKSGQAALMSDKDINNECSTLITEAVNETVAIPQSSLLTDTRNNTKTTPSEISVSSETREIFTEVPHSETAQIVAQSGSYVENECGAKKDLEDTKINETGGIPAEIPEVESDSGNDQKASDATATVETQATSQTQAYDDKKIEDKTEAKQPSKPQVLDTNKTLGSQLDEEVAQPGTGNQGKTDEFSKDPPNGENHQGDTISTAPQIIELETEAASANTCQVTSVKQDMDTSNKTDTKETKHSRKEDLADKVGIKSHPEAISTSSKTEALQEETVQQASASVKEKPDDKSSSESHPEEAASAGITENISDKVTPAKEELHNKAIQNAASTTVENEILETESACQATSVKPGDKSSVEVGKQENVSIVETEVTRAKSSKENTIQHTSVEEELDVKSGYESHQPKVPTNAETEVLQAQLSSENTPPDATVSVEVTDKNGIKPTVQSVTQEPDDKSSSEGQQEENTSTLQETKSAREGSGEESPGRSIQKQAASTSAVKEISEVQASVKSSYQQTKSVKEELGDKLEEQLEDKSSEESTPEETSSHAPVKEILEAPTIPKNEEPDDQTTSVVDSKDKIQTKTSHEISSHS